MIEPAEYEVIADIDSMIATLTQKHAERTKDDPHFDYYRRFEDRINFNRNITHVSLNEDERRARRAESAAWRLKTENDYLRALGEETAPTIEELDEIMRELPRKRAEEVDGMVQESGRILLDYININPMLAYREGETAAALEN